MAYDTTILKADLSQITQRVFEEAIFLAYAGGISTMAPLGFSGDTVLLHGESTPEVSRRSMVSVRNYSGDAELLITDAAGKFLFYGRLSIDFGVEVVAEFYWDTFQRVRRQIEGKMPKSVSFRELALAPGCTLSDGFQLMADAQAHRRRYVALGLYATEEAAAADLDTCGYAGKWKSAKAYITEHSPGLEGPAYWDAVRLHFLELGGCWLSERKAA